MKFSRTLGCFWTFSTLVSVTSVCLGAWIFGSIYYLESIRSFKLDPFFSDLFLWVLGEIVASTLSIIYTAYLHCKLATKKIEEKIPAWIFLNILFIYVAFGCFLFPTLREYEDEKRTPEPNTTTHKSENEQIQFLKIITHVYYGILIGKCILFGGLILSLYEHRLKINRIELLLDELNLGGNKSRKWDKKRDSFIL